MVKNLNAQFIDKNRDRINIQSAELSKGGAEYFGRNKILKI